MAGGGVANKKISAASARAHTRKSKPKYASFLISGLFKKLLLVSLGGLLAWGYQAIRPPPPKICGTSVGPPVTAPRIKLRDGRHLAYKEHGVPTDEAKFKFIFVHGFDSWRHHAIGAVRADLLSSDEYKALGIYLVSFDRPGYGESDPDPNRTEKSIAVDIEELADQLGLGKKFYVIGFSMGGQVIWGCLKYIPHRLAGATLLAPAINYWWSSLPGNLSSEAFSELSQRDRWSLRVAHYAPWLTYWWNTQKLFPSYSVIARLPAVLSHNDKEVFADLRGDPGMQMRQQGEFESVHRDMRVCFGKTEFDPTNLTNPFPDREGSVHLWQGDEDMLVPVTLQRYIIEKLPWVHYHELPGRGHMFPLAKGMDDAIIKAQLSL